MKKYYIEFVDGESGEYVMQSRWFNRASTAEEWLKDNFDFIIDGIGVFIMSSEFEQGEYGDIEVEKAIR